MLSDTFGLKNFLCFLFILISIFGFAQNPYYHSIDKSIGLPSNSVYDIYQDKKGFMWFATNKGICRYDGSKFISYTSDSQSSVAGSNIAEDQFGRIWYCNFDGYLYYIENGKLKMLNQPETIGYFKYGIIDNLLYLIQKSKVLIYDLKTLKPIVSHKIEDKIVYFTFSDDKKFYVLADYFYEFSGTKNVKKYNIPDDFKKNYTAPIIQKTTDGLILISKNQSNYYLFQNGNFIKKNFSVDIKFIQNISYVNQENWISSTNGIYKNAVSGVKHYFSDYNISSIFRDDKGYYWISTLNKGLILVEDLDSQFVQMSSRPILFNQSGKDFLISSEKGSLYQLDENNFSVKQIYQGDNNHSVNQLLADKNGNIYFTYSTFNILNLKNKNQSKIYLAVKEIRKVDDKYYSFSSSGMSGIFPIDKASKSIWDKAYNSAKKGNAGFDDVEFLGNSNGKSTVYNSQNKTIYYATNVGLFAKTLDDLKELKLNNNRLFISKLANYQNQTFALATNGKLFEISNNNQISELSVPENLKQENISKIKIIADKLYLFTEQSLFQYHLSNHQFQKIISGNNDLDISDIAIINDKNIFATSKGLLIKNQINSAKNNAPKLIINQILVNDKNIGFNELKDLKNNQNNVAISLSALSFVPTQKTEIWYRINDNHWQVLEKENRDLVLNSLSYGNYNIDFKAKTENQFSETKRISFTISKPFWLELWFILPIIFIISGLIYLIFKLRIKKIRQQNQLILDKIQLEKNLNQSKLKAIKSQMNPHFFYNALNTIQAYVLSNEKKLAVNYLSKFSLLTRTILEMSEKEMVNISEEIKTIKLYLEIEKARFDDDFEYEINLDENIDKDNEKIPSMLLQPYIENAIKHGLLHKKGEKKLLISFTKLNEMIEIKIDDNGIGRKKSNELNLIKTKKHPSFATDAMQKRIDILNLNNPNKIELSFHDKMNEAKVSLGTTVVIKIPIDQ